MRWYDDYDVSDHISTAQAITVFTVFLTLLCLTIHYPCAMFFRLLGFKAVLNPGKVVPAYAGSIITGFALLFVWDELRTIDRIEY